MKLSLRSKILNQMVLNILHKSQHLLLPVQLPLFLMLHPVELKMETKAMAALETIETVTVETMADVDHLLVDLIVGEVDLLLVDLIMVVVDL